MIKKILKNKLVKNSSVYVIADVINKAIPFILLPILTYYLSPKDYGALATFSSLVTVLAIFIGLSVHGIISVNYYKLNKEQMAQYIGNIVYILLSSFFLSVIIITFSRSFLQEKLSLPFKWMIVAAIAALASFFVRINLALWIVEKKPKNYGIFQIIETILKFGLSLFFVIALAMSWKGRILGIFIGGLITALASIYILHKRGYLNFKLNKHYIIDALKFGVPLVPHQLSIWMRSGAIIFILVYLVGKNETGLYNVARQFVIPIAVLNAAFNKAWAPNLYQRLTNTMKFNEKIKIVKFTYLYFLVILLIATILVFISPILINLLLEKNFSDSSAYIVYLAYAAAFHGMYLMVVNYIYYEKKTDKLAYITFSTSFVNLILAYWLINRNGALGAAQSYLITSVISFLLVWYYSNKIYKMPWFFKSSKKHS